MCVLVQVQDAVSNCLPHLVTSPALAAEIQPIMNKLMKQLLTAEKYGDRRVSEIVLSISYQLMDAIKIFYMT